VGVNKLITIQMYEKFNQKQSKFFRDLENNKRWELYFGNQLKKNLFGNIKYSDDKRFDIICDKYNEEYKFEVKCDMNADVYYRTGFEVESWNKPAGVYATEADYYVIFYPQFSFYAIIDINIFIPMLNEQEYVERKTGDEQMTKMFLWDMDYFFHECQKIAKERNLIFKIIKNDFSSMIDDNISKYLKKKKENYKTSNEGKRRQLNNEKINKHFNNNETTRPNN